jgi:hypothetical protein
VKCDTDVSTFLSILREGYLDALAPMKRNGLLGLRAAWLLGAFLCAQPIGAEENNPSRAAGLPPGIKPLEVSGLHNVFALGTNVFSGSSPEGEEAFAALAMLGVKSIITVDGARPNVEAARRHGLRYVHLPHGYDGINTSLQMQLSKVGQSLAGPFYVHCHHGKHRGPTAAAVICMTLDGWTPVQAEAWLMMAGTATNYVGLYDVVRGFSKPTGEQLDRIPRTFPEIARVSGLVDAMVTIDERWEHLKAVRAAGYQVPKQHPDLKPPNEAVILWEHYREAQRLPDVDIAGRGAKFVESLKKAEAEARDVERLLRLFANDPRPDVRAQLDKGFGAMGKTCASCHADYRD